MRFFQKKISRGDVFQKRKKTEEKEGKKKKRREKIKKGKNVLVLKREEK